MRELAVLKPVAALEHLTLLDPVVHELHRVLDRVLKPRALEDVLHGVPAGHPVHPVLVQIPIGAWTSAAILDALPATGRVSRFLVGVGVLSSASAILTGWADWTRTRLQAQRVGLVHAAANEAGTVLYAASWLARRTGHDGAGRLIGWSAFGLITAGGYLGGHLAYRQAVGANHAESAPYRFPDGWQVVGPLDELPEAAAVRRDVAGEPLFVLRRGGRVDVLSDVGSHRGEALHDGALDLGVTTTITSPGPGGTWDVGTGEVLAGPATAPQPRFETRVTDGVVEVRAVGTD